MLGAGLGACCWEAPLLTRWLREGPLWMSVSRAFWTLGLSKLMPEAEVGGLWTLVATGIRPGGFAYPWDAGAGGPGIGGRDGFWEGDWPRDPYECDCEGAEGRPVVPVNCPLPLLNRLRILACSSCWWLGLAEVLEPADRLRWPDCGGVWVDEGGSAAAEEGTSWCTAGGGPTWTGAVWRHISYLLLYRNHCIQQKRQ